MVGAAPGTARRLRRVPRASARQRRLGQNFLADPNLLDAIVRDSGVEPGDVVLEVGGGAGALTERLAPAASELIVIEMDERLRPELESLAKRLGNVRLIWADAVRADLAAIEPSPTRMVSNLPYSVATPVLLRTIEQLPGMSEWLVMVQREIADRLRAEPGGREYGAPSVLAQLACEVSLVRSVDRAVFTPRPRVNSALLRLRRRAPAAAPGLRELVREGFAHRRKSLARSLELARPGRAERVREALARIGERPDARAQSLAPAEFEALWEQLR